MKSLLVIRFSKIVFFTETGCYLNSILFFPSGGVLPSRYDSFFRKNQGFKTKGKGIEIPLNLPLERGDPFLSIVIRDTRLMSDRGQAIFNY